MITERQFQVFAQRLEDLNKETVQPKDLQTAIDRLCNQLSEIAGYLSDIDKSLERIAEQAEKANL